MKTNPLNRLKIATAVIIVSFSVNYSFAKNYSTVTIKAKESIIDINEELAEQLEIETWMSNDACWTTAKEFLETNSDEYAEMEDLNIENWMVDNKLWNYEKIHKEELISTDDTKLEIQHWMTEEKRWGF